MFGYFANKIFSFCGIKNKKLTLSALIKREAGQACCCKGKQ